jgi:hypothetical protein
MRSKRRRGTTDPMTSRHEKNKIAIRLSTLLTTLGAVLMLSASTCGPEVPAPECTSDADCGAERCVASTCVACASADDCADGGFCCRGACLASTELEANCGCGASPAASAGADCGASENALCVAAGLTVTPSTVAEGQCACTCSAAEGGPTCEAPPAPGEAPLCSCAENSECRGATEDSDGQIHRVADTCTPQGSCVCFSLGTANVCGGATPDCASAGGCASFGDDVDNCGVAARVCTDEATGIAGTGACVTGGCTCNDAGDCQGAGLNVNSCAFVEAGEPSRCVCSGYQLQAGGPSACPLELECVAGGCELDGVAHATEAALRQALGLPVAVD